MAPPVPRATKTKECPVDWTKLVEENVDLPGFDVKIDRCPKCHGVFLDKGEVKRVTGNPKLNEFLTKHVALDSDSPRVCPADGMVMDMEDADGTKVDVCLTCYGVWLDAGELDELKKKKPEAFEPSAFTDEKRKELQRAKEVGTRDRQKAWKMFLWRLSGRDMIDRQTGRNRRL